ncbi:uncharacterized protein LOC104457208 [Eucalyptus grandis]|uniref:uncharacterized protein LOC104457208 n=1 Tax=Eucalyptus grandis TaxID=71139 RepID=UPI00192E821E|nr:uncharacterized protein LOC104457208 [Eucalyptus grandis]
MPKWLLPNEDGYISFVASKDMYKKILGVAFCVVFRVEGTKKNWTFEVMGVVDGKVTKHMRFVRSFNSDHVWLEYMESKKVWTVDPFSPNDSSHFHFSIRTLGYCYSGTIRMTDELIVKKCGFRLICKPLENDAEVLLEDDQLLDPALLYEVLHEDNPASTEKENSSETENLQDSEPFTKKEELNMVDFSIERCQRCLSLLKTVLCLSWLHKTCLTSSKHCICVLSLV